MSVKYYCDNCSVEMRDSELGRLKVTLGGVSVEVMRAWNNVWNGGHVYHGCIRDAIIRGKPDERGTT